MLQVQIQLKAQYGELRSFLTEKYPEARHRALRPPEEQAEEQ